MQRSAVCYPTVTGILHHNDGLLLCGNLRYGTHAPILLPNRNDVTAPVASVMAAGASARSQQAKNAPCDAGPDVAGGLLLLVVTVFEVTRNAI